MDPTAAADLMAAAVRHMAAQGRMVVQLLTAARVHWAARVPMAVADHTEVCRTAVVVRLAALDLQAV